MNVVQFPRAPQVDAREFLGAVCEDLDNKIMPKVVKGLLIHEYETGQFSVWSFGPEGGGDHVPIALASLAHALLIDKILGS